MSTVLPDAGAVKAPAHVLTVPEVADAARVTRPTIYNLVKRGELDAITVGSAIRVPRRAVADLIGIEQLEAWEAGRNVAAA